LFILKFALKVLMRLIGALFVLIVFCAVAFAQSTDTTVHLGWGDIIGQLGLDLVPWVASLLVAALVGLVAKFFPVAGAILTKERTQAVEQLLERGLGFAASNAQAQLKGKELTVDVKNKLIADAVQYALDHGSRAILDYIGGETALPDKVNARLLTSPAVKAAQIGTQPPFPTTSP